MSRPEGRNNLSQLIPRLQRSTIHLRARTQGDALGFHISRRWRFTRPFHKLRILMTSRDPADESADYCHSSAERIKLFAKLRRSFL
jgi:hypothetical protein